MATHDDTVGIDHVDFALVVAEPEDGHEMPCRRLAGHLVLPGHPAYSLATRTPR
ncbi:MAG: hypothetical protein ACR2JZ_01645 [Candidatus Limnocylindrales bacterium]